MKKTIIICALVLALVSIAIVGYADTELSAEFSIAEAVVIAEEPSSFCVLIPSTIYVGENVTLTAEFINIRDNEQVNVIVNNLNDQNSITLTSEDGSTMPVYFSGNGNNAGTFINNGELTSTHFFHFRSEGGRAGSYSGTAEFTVNISPRQN